MQVYGIENIPETGPYLVTINHYTRPGFGSWWLALGVSSVLDVEVQWIVAEAWTYPDPLRSRLLTPVTRWMFRRMARVYGFTSMPPMPPRSQDAQARAQAVRRVLEVARRGQRPVIGIAPEGQDFSGERLGSPPPGVGRFIGHLAQAGLRILPVGVYEDGDAFCLHFGSSFALDIPDGLSAAERDHQVSQEVMSQIAILLPDTLSSEFTLK